MNLLTYAKELKTNKTKRTKLITFVTMIYNFFWSLCKILFGVFMHTYLYCISGIYTLLFGFIKKIFISNHNTDKKVNIEIKSLIMGILLTIIGTVFGIYMGRLFFMKRDYQYGLIWSIIIALCSFVELGVAIYNLIKVNKKNDILLFSLRCCNMSSSLFAIVLTQVALLSATEMTNSAKFNASVGSIAGFLVVVLGLVVIAKSAYQDKKQKEKQNEILQKKQTPVLTTFDSSEIELNKSNQSQTSLESINENNKTSENNETKK